MQSTHQTPWTDGAPPPDRRAPGAHRRLRQPVAARLWAAAATVNGGVLATLLVYGDPPMLAVAGAAFLELVLVCAVLVTWSEPAAAPGGPLPETPPFGWPIYPAAARTRPIRRQP